MSDQYFIWEGPNGTRVDFVDKMDHTILECMECGEQWCKHMQYAVVHNLDQEWVWNGDWLARMIQVPMFPTQGIWATAKLLLIEDAPARMARLHYQGSESSIPISYLHPGEGLNVIRTTFLDYMQGNRQVADKIICKSPSHKYK